jgi:hypothetical protein
VNTNGKDPVEEAVEVLVYAPIGLALMAWKTVPRLVGEVISRGRAELGDPEGRVANTVNQARMIGQMAVAYGGHQIRREVDHRLADARRRAEGLTGRAPHPDGLESDPPAATPPPATPPPASTRKAPAARNVAAPATSPRAQDLPIPEYDGLSASQVVQRLTGLLPGELAAVRAYEANGRGRKTVLGAIDRLHP